MVNRWTPQIERCIQALRDFDDAVGNYKEVARLLREQDGQPLCANVATAIEAFVNRQTVIAVTANDKEQEK